MSNKNFKELVISILAPLKLCFQFKRQRTQERKLLITREREDSPTKERVLTTCLKFLAREVSFRDFPLAVLRCREWERYRVAP